MAAFIPSLITGIAGVAGGLLNKPQTTTTNQNSTTNTTGNQSGVTSGTSLPTYDPYQLKMRDYLINQFYNNSNPAAIHGLVNNSVNAGTNAINDSAGPQEQALRAALAARGLSYSGAGGTAIAQNQANRIGQITQLQGQVPLLEDQLRQGRLTDFSNYLSKLPVGTTTNQTSNINTSGQSVTNGTSTQTGSSNILGGAAYGLGTTLAGLYGQGAFKGTPTPYGNMNTSGGGGSN